MSEKDKTGAKSQPTAKAAVATVNIFTAGLTLPL
jgi:hypothetical protein